MPVHRKTSTGNTLALVGARAEVGASLAVAAAVGPIATSHLVAQFATEGAHVAAEESAHASGGLCIALSVEG